MDDDRILALYFARDPDAIRLTDETYGAYLTSIAANILPSHQDAEECVNDTYLRAWNAIPPQCPRIFRAFLAKITRNLSLNRHQANHAQRRGGQQITLALDELAECVSGQDDVEQILDRKALPEALNGWLSALPPLKRRIFLRRYWYFDSVKEIARRTGLTQTHVSVMLHRLRHDLRTFLTERGFHI